MKIVTVIGARPQFIKAGSVSREINKRANNGANIIEKIIHTGQHYDANMSNVFFKEMKIPKPDYFLGIGGNTHGAMTGQMLEKIENILIDEKPDLVMVYGDTNSTLAGALAASKLQIKIAHIEAGLRSFNNRMPEEVNRILTDRISSFLFCPTQIALDNLHNEGFNAWKTEAKISLVGDVMQDGALFYKTLAKKPSELEIEKDYVLCTIHRAENTDDSYRIKGIFEALDMIAQKIQVILPLHPRTKKTLEYLDINLENITIFDPVGYLNMIWLIDNCSLVMTDSGGLQKEAYFFSKPCITLRDETEWVELVEIGANVLVGADKESIINAFTENITPNDRNTTIDLYGNGKASERIIDELLNE